ncbi:hypothetical protein PoB_006360200 [Plakobranchus ocellatus]|uniref:Uncharacterized protein n=1 Tax=Plakobranchus ocellatus TaxID=259542 RepID=A0AAV4CYV0_9GAST|nr:hypothetical protein PoB_006360200 [Plakobranchus ocellatus]
MAAIFVFMKVTTAENTTTTTANMGTSLGLSIRNRGFKKIFKLYMTKARIFFNLTETHIQLLMAMALTVLIIEANRRKTGCKRTISGVKRIKDARKGTHKQAPIQPRTPPRNKSTRSRQ